MKNKFQFWYEFGSTYSHIASHRIDKLAAKFDVSVQWKPFLLGPIFKNQGWDTSPFNIYESKGRYMWRDIERQCRKYGVPFSKPSVFPRNGLLASRIALLAESENWCPTFSKLIYQANFIEDKDISDEEVIAGILSSLGQDADSIIDRSKSDENNRNLKLQTEEAVRIGIFGAPTFVCGDEIFWGNDRLEDALYWYTNHKS